MQASGQNLAQREQPIQIVLSIIGLAVRQSPVLLFKAEPGLVIGAWNLFFLLGIFIGFINGGLIFINYILSLLGKFFTDSC